MTKSSLYRHATRLCARPQLGTRSIAQSISPRSAIIAGPSALTSCSRIAESHRHSSSSSSSSSPNTRSDPFSTVNADEISHFSRLSSEWWSTEGEFALLHRMNPARVEYIRQKLLDAHLNEEEWTFENRHRHHTSTTTTAAGTGTGSGSGSGTGKWLNGLKVLDVGCGGGLLAESLARLGGDVLAIDAGKENIEIAKIHAQGDPFLPFEKRAEDGSRLEYRWTPAERLKEEGKQFDVVTSMEVIEHVDEPGEFLKCLGDMVKPGGHLILSTISRTPLSQLLTLTLAEDVLRLVTPGTHTYSKFIKPEELRQFVYKEMGGHDVWERNQDASDVRHGEVGETRGIVYNPLKGGWDLWGGAEGSWGKSAGELCNYMFYARKRLDAV